MKSKDYKIIIILTFLLITIFDFGLRLSVEVFKEIKDHNHEFNFWNIVPYTKGDRSSMKLTPYLVFQGKKDDENNPRNKTRSRKRYYEPQIINRSSSNILLLGGSVVENMSINLDRIEDTLSNIGYDYQFINCGWSAYNITQEFILLSQTINTIKPQVIVLFDGFNDIWLSLYDGYPVGYPQHFKNIEAINQYVDSPYRSLLNDFADRIFPVRLVKYKLKNIKPDKRTPSDRKNISTLISENYNQYVKNIAALCMLNNAQLIVVHQPSIFTKKNLSVDEMAWVKGHEFEWSFKDNYLDAWNVLKEETQTLSLELGFGYYDWSTLFNQTNETVYFDVVHFQKNDDSLNIADKILINGFKNMLIKNYAGLKDIKRQ